MPPSNLFWPWKYHSVPSSASDDGPELELKSTSSAHSAGAKLTYLELVAPWIASTFCFALLATYFGVKSARQASLPLPPGPFETDFQAAKAVVEYEARVFTGKLDYDPISGQAYRVVDPFQPQYFGRPSPKIEAAWDELLRDEFSIMLDSEAEPFRPELEPLPTDGEYHFEFDVFHSLHCLNAVRKRLDGYYLGTHHDNSINETVYSKNWERVHMDHCLDQLRQSIQCHGDLSPVPVYWWQGFHLALGQGKKHTCRKWEPIREWMDQRAAALRRPEGDP